MDQSIQQQLSIFHHRSARLIAAAGQIDPFFLFIYFFQSIKATRNCSLTVSIYDSEVYYEKEEIHDDVMVFHS
jgi:hypothetical protein